LYVKQLKIYAVEIWITFPFFFFTFGISHGI
jgi:amino acid permease